MRALDRYVLLEWLRIFIVTAFGFPVLIVIIDLTEKLDTYLQRRIPAGDIAVSYIYGVPETMFQVLPAAVLFATVFTVSAFTRYSEISAAKASGISFHRFILPLTLGAVFAMCVGFSLNVIIPPLNLKKLNLLQEQKFKDTGERYNFAFSTGEGRTYKVGALHASRNVIDNIEVERLGLGPALPTTYAIAEQAAVVNVQPGSGWLLANVACSRRAVQKEAVVRDDDGVLEVERLQLVDGHSNLFQ